MLYNKNSKINFGEAMDGQNWTIVNDDVMGGLSNSTMTLTQNSLIFAGELSFKNNGGFASIRSSNQSFNLSKYETVHIKYRSNGREFAFRLASPDMDFRTNYKQYFSSSTKDWEMVELNMSNFKEYHRGQVSGGEVSKDKLENIIRIGIMISDNKEGPFKIEIDYIEFK
ncbi:MAG: CIA30 family protein [Xanthomarina sp.]